MGIPDFYADYVLPRVYKDIFGRVYVDLEDLKGVEIVDEGEKRRFDAALIFYFPSLLRALLRHVSRESWIGMVRESPGILVSCANT